ncbi:hypothetical protein HYX13_00805 [Candidatus Woesearchaeota archaeon]|nr:hypothetical protein [Candidatus Woesearchaeota archaeon]
MYKSIFKSLKISDIFGVFVGIVLIIVGWNRISMGISSIRISDAYTAHFMNVGLLYLFLALIILIFLAIKITYSFKK